MLSTPLEEVEEAASNAALAKCMTRVASGVAVFLSPRLNDAAGRASPRHLLTAAVAALYGAPAPEAAARGRAHVCWATAAGGAATVTPQLLAAAELPLERRAVLSCCAAGNGFEFGQSAHIGKRLKHMRGLDEQLANDIDLLRQLY